MKYFKSITLGKIVIMGRETYESLPGKEPLKDRINVILSRNASLSPNGFIVCHSLEELFKFIEKYDKDDVIVIGGEQVYSLLLPYCDEVYITKFNKAFTADKHFTRLDNDPDWKLEFQGENKSYKDMDFCFTTYVRINNKPQ